MAVDTKHVSGRRTLHFASIDDALRDARTLADADARGTLKPLGNWTPGQAFGHVAGWINFAFDGYPPDLRPPWFVKLLVRPMKSKYLKGLPAGISIPKVQGGTKNIELFATSDGLARLTAAWGRLAQRRRRTQTRSSARWRTTSGSLSTSGTPSCTRASSCRSRTFCAVSQTSGGFGLAEWRRV
ncbi:MAG: DUF1569 domain-containing protein [Phycisphaerales bacterium]